MIKGRLVVQAPLGHGRVHIVFYIRVLAGQDVFQGLLRLDDTAVVGVAGWTSGLAQEDEEHRLGHDR